MRPCTLSYAHGGHTPRPTQGGRGGTPPLILSAVRTRRIAARGVQDSSLFLLRFRFQHVKDHRGGHEAPRERNNGGTIPVQASSTSVPAGRDPAHALWLHKQSASTRTQAQEACRYRTGTGPCGSRPAVSERGTGQTAGYQHGDVSRKEVFQPHLPVRLPCYDLAPITGFALGRPSR